MPVSGLPSEYAEMKIRILALEILAGQWRNSLMMAHSFG